MAAGASRSLPDRLVLAFDRGLRTVTGTHVSARPHPDRDLPEGELADPDRRHAAALIRVDHTGEVCAQALYQGQALTSRDPDVRALLEKAAAEETDHLAWTESRLAALGGRKSLLNPLFYAGSFVLGTLSGLAGDRWNLGFLAETERQVEQHLDGHLRSLPAEDTRSRAVVEAMRADEVQHARTATGHGGEDLPAPLRLAMRALSRVMTAAAYRL